MGDSVYGQHDANWLGFYEYFQDVCGLKDETQKLKGLIEGAQAHGWWLPCENICFVAERHNILKRDDNGQLHCEDGPACAFPDGYEIYSWHGTRVPEDWIKNPKSLTPDMAITWENVEQRRCVAEILGWVNILKDPRLNAKTIDRDDDPEIGELIEVNIPDIGREKFLKVVCGTGRDFALPVPPDMKTALEAQAWLNFCTTEDILNIEVRT